MKKYIFAVVILLLIIFALDRCSTPRSGTKYTNNTTATSSGSQAVSTLADSKAYVGNKRNGKLHSIYCVSLPYEDNRVYFATEEEAKNAGYTDTHKECMGH